MAKKVIGSCGHCGGRVSVPDAWLGINPPVPSCESCGAKAQHPQLPVVPMEPSHIRTVYDAGTAALRTGTATYRLGDY